MQCQCGRWSGEPCSTDVDRSETVAVEFMPECWRESHESANNCGEYPHNGAERVRVSYACARMMIEADRDWCKVIGSADDFATFCAVDWRRQTERKNDAGARSALVLLADLISMQHDRELKYRLPSGDTPTSSLELAAVAWAARWDGEGEAGR